MPGSWALGAGAAALPAGAQVADALPLHPGHAEACRTAQSIPRRCLLDPDRLAGGAPSLLGLAKYPEY